MLTVTAPSVGVDKCLRRFSKYVSEYDFLYDLLR